MPERAVVAQGVQIGVETTPGTVVPANKKFTALSIEKQFAGDLAEYRPMGSKFVGQSVVGREWAGLTIRGPLTFTEIVYPLASGLVYLAPVQIGVTTGYTWTFTPANSNEDIVKTYTIETGSSVQAERMANGIITGITIRVSRQEAVIEGTGIAKAVVTGATLTAAPTAIALVPVLPKQFDVFADDTAAALGTTKLLRCLRAELSMSGRFNPIWPINSAMTSFDGVVESVPTWRFTLRMAADAVGMAYVNQMRAGTTKFIRMRAIGDNIGASADYTVQVDVAAQVGQMMSFQDEDGLQAIEIPFTVVQDGTWGKSVEIKVVNKLTAL